ncbi:hypothetical protein T484DRAFT_1920435, partial [Baffinella frigidus]
MSGSFVGETVGKTLTGLFGGGGGMKMEVPGSVALSAAMLAGASWYLFSSGETVMNREQGRARARMVKDMRDKEEAAAQARGEEADPENDGTFPEFGASPLISDQEEGFVWVDEGPSRSESDPGEDGLSQLSGRSSHGRASTGWQSTSSRGEPSMASGPGGPGSASPAPGLHVHGDERDQVIQAVFTRDVAAVVTALEMGVDVELADDYCNTLLILAAQAGSPAVALELLIRGADPNARNWRGFTALDFARALEPPALDFARALEQEEIHERVALDFARALEHHALMDLLLARGARPDERDVAPALAARSVPRRANSVPLLGDGGSGASSPAQSPRYLDTPREMGAFAPPEVDDRTGWRLPTPLGSPAGRAKAGRAVPEAPRSLPAPLVQHEVAQRALREAARLVASGQGVAQRAALFAAPGDASSTDAKSAGDATLPGAPGAPGREVGR